MPTGQVFAPMASPGTPVEIAARYPGMSIRNALTTNAQDPAALGGLRLEQDGFPGGGTGNAPACVCCLKVQIGGAQEPSLFQQVAEGGPASRATIAGAATLTGRHVADLTRCFAEQA